MIIQDLKFYFRWKKTPPPSIYFTKKLDNAMVGYAVICAERRRYQNRVEEEIFRLLCQDLWWWLKGRRCSFCTSEMFLAYPRLSCTSCHSGFYRRIQSVPCIQITIHRQLDENNIKISNFLIWNGKSKFCCY